MIIIASLLFAGLALILLEFYTPGSLMAILGSVALLGSAVLFGVWSKSFFLSFCYLIVEILLVMAMVKLAIRRIAKGKAGEGIYLKGDQEGFKGVDFDASMIGEKGIAISDLKPSGHIEVLGKAFQAVSQGAYIDKGSPIVVTGGRGASLIVKEDI